MQASIMTRSAGRTLLAIVVLAAFVISYLALVRPVSADEHAGPAALKVQKFDMERNRLPGAVFTVEGLEGTWTTGADGSFCITGLPEDAVYTVTEIQAPEGYELADPASQLVEVDNDGDCSSPDAIFFNEKSDGGAQPGTSTPPAATSPPASPSQASPSESTKGSSGGPGGGGTLPDTATTSPVTGIVVLGLLFVGSLATLGGRRLATIARRR